MPQKKIEPAKENVMERSLHFKISNELWAFLKEAALYEGLSVSVMARTMLVRLYFEGHKKVIDKG
jgi:hypothetical protein